MNFLRLKRAFRHHVWSITNIPALIALVIAVAFWQFSELQNRHIHEQTVRADVINHASLIATDLEGRINANLQLAQGLAATLAAQPRMTPEEFSKIASKTFDENSELVIVAGAPDLVISMIYPVEGNEKAIGLDYNKNAAQRAAALRARDEKQLILAGPVNLVQGGQGFIGRYPVFADTPSGEEFWGIVSAVIDVNKIYTNSGLLDPELPIEISLSGRDSLGVNGGNFFGPDMSDDVFAVQTSVDLPNGSWMLSARPKGGWHTVQSDMTTLRFWIVIGALLIVIPSGYSGYLMRLARRQNKLMKKREQRLGLVSERLNVALASSNVGVWEANLKSGERFWDARTNLLFGLEPEDRTREANVFEKALHPDDRERVLSDFNAAIANKQQYMTQFRIVLPSGEARHLQSRCAYYHPEGDDPRMVGVNWDVTEDVELKEDLVKAKQFAEQKNVELERMQQQIRHLALHDPLTSLPNRRFLDQTIADYQRPAGDNMTVAMLALDLDRFKQINDTLGHRAGDETLKHVAQVLQSKIDEKDFVARVGGDEFVIIVERSFDKSELAALASDIITTLKEPLIFEGHACRFGASIGVAIDESKSPDLQELLIQADIALYRAKEMGRNCFEFFSDDQQARIVKARQDSEEILWGLELGQFIPYYQPQFDAKTGRVVGVEALARWDHPDKGVLGPLSFMKVAEDINVIDDIDHDILATVIDDMANWGEAGLQIDHASVNVSSPRLHDENLLRRLNELDIQPNKITFELLESIFLDEDDDVIERNLKAIKELGIDIDIDDFGTGHASIVGLLKLQPKRIKIDRQFVREIEENQDQRRLTKSMIDMGKSLGIEVLAEGVETQAQVDILKSYGVDAFQGYFYAKPMAAADLKQFLKKLQTKAS